MSSKELQHAWFELARMRSWSALALAPVHDGTETLGLAEDFARLACRDPRQKVLLINATGVATKAARAVTPGQEKVDATFGEGIISAAGGKYGLLDCAKLGHDSVRIGAIDVPQHVQQARERTGPFTLVLVALPCLLSHPDAIQSARSVDGVILCVPLGTSTFAEAQRTKALIGEEQVAGALALRSRA